ncbi:Carboxyl-terminal-processing peptidase 1 [Cardamine amara subsp. amara]|uniref:C-terminal processing peptidase n=1 Tax=Cardamine amara subsp. amara TaxID=228776 RepID=A0ABD1BDT8_CARAN
MRILLPFSSPLSATSSPVTPHFFPESPPPSQIDYSALSKILKKSVIGTLTGALSLTLVFSSPISSVAAANDPYLSLNPPSSSIDSSLNHFDSVPEDCPNEEEEADTEMQDDDFKPQLVVTNEGIVEEGWEIVNDAFLDSRSHSWIPETWQKQKDTMLASPVKSRSKAHEVIKKMLASLGDQYTRFLSPDEDHEFSRMSKYDITGIGINLREVSDGGGNVKLKVLGLVLDSPTDIAGVKQRDEILAVNGVDVSGKSSFEVSSLLQGPSKTYVDLKVKHGNCGPVKSIKLQRQVNAKTPVSYRLEKVENGNISVGYIRLKEFNALARKDLVIAMKRLQEKGASYFVMDLRDNLGGLVQAGIETAKLFLDEGDTVIYTAGRDPKTQKAVLADKNPLITSPLIVMVNNRTASASEIVASALHDNCKAVLVGERTYGKGLIQSVYELRDGSGVVVTVGKYVTPNHMDINGGGIEPDFRNLPAWDEVKEHLSKCNIL